MKTDNNKMINIFTTLFTLLILIDPISVKSQSEIQYADNIMVNQIGYYPYAPKLAVVKEYENADKFYIVTTDLRDTVYTGALNEKRKSLYSGKSTVLANFSGFNKKGEFLLIVPELGKSAPFEIKEDVYADLAAGSMKSYYFQRTSMPLEPQYAGKWSRNAGHPDEKVFIHASAVSEGRPEGTVINSTRGWYDAGDYNKYIVNSGITMGTIFSLYEDFPEQVRSLSLNILESGNGIPDFLDEALFNLRWMLTMQDHDGGVYHKLTAAEFEGMIRPEEAKGKRFVVQKSTEATLDFAAVMAQASRIFREFEDHLPGLADSTLEASQRAWRWALENPDKHYDQKELNKNFDPDINTGAYGDKDADDEFYWAAAELWATTGDLSFAEAIEVEVDTITIPSWPNVETMGLYTYLRFKEKYPDHEFPENLKKRVLQLADQLLDAATNNAYGVVMGGDPNDFRWGSNAIAANQGIAMVYAYKLTRDQKYLDHALGNLDYLLGRNATGYSFVTGYGQKTPMHIHHRPSVSDNIEEPVPGMLAGGPNPSQQDKCEYPFDAADESYIDEVCSYASNEIAINWNAPLVYLVNALEALKYEAGYTKK
ncbi:MAG: glycoside hydrolase family 9 protein [Candidatus Cyclobacteriaceae bacterium M2_1C_046]